MPRDHSGATEAEDSVPRGRARRTDLIRRVQWTVLGLVAIGLVLFALTRSQGGGVSVDGRAALGERAPEVVMDGFDGETVRLSQFQGTPVVLNFWASWCPQCVAEMPDFERVHQELADRVQFVGVNQSDNKAAAEDLAEETGVTYLLTSDPTGQIFRAFGGAGMPTTVFIDGDGSVRDVVTGQLTQDQLEDRIEEAFGAV